MSYKVLIVDDNPNNVKLLAYNLSDEGYEILSASNGKIAIQLARQHDPDVILLDVLMPEMDGIETCQKIKADNKLRHIPVIIISALEEEDEMIEALKAGAQDYIVKPFNFPLVEARIRLAIQIKRAVGMLSEKNIELKELAYSVSDNLQEPISTIRSCGQLLSEELKESSSEKAVAYLDMMIETVDQLQNELNRLSSTSADLSSSQNSFPELII